VCDQPDRWGGKARGDIGNRETMGHTDPSGRLTQSSETESCLKRREGVEALETSRADRGCHRKEPQRRGKTTKAPPCLVRHVQAEFHVC